MADKRYSRTAAKYLAIQGFDDGIDGRRMAPDKKDDPIYASNYRRGRGEREAVAEAEVSARVIDEGAH